MTVLDFVAVTGMDVSAVANNGKAAIRRAGQRQRSLVDKFFSKLKHYRGVSTRYDKLTENFLAAVNLVATWL